MVDETETPDSADEDLPTFEKFDENGRYVTRITVNFGGSPIDAERLREKGASIKTEEDGTWWAECFLFPDGEQLDDGTPYAAAKIHSHGPEHDETHWEIAFVRAPGGPIPPELRADAFKGTFPSNLADLLALIGSHTVDATARASYLISENHFEGVLEQMSFFQARDVAGVNMLLESMSWDVLTSQSLTRMTLQISQYSHAAWVSARGEINVKLSATLRDDVDDVLWREVTKCLTVENTAEE